MGRAFLVLQILIVGLGAGAGYGLVGIGYSLIYRLTGVIHFALGELTSLTVFATLFVLAGTGPVTRTNAGAGRFLLALAAGLALAIGAGMAVYWLTVRPFLTRGVLAGWVGATVALAFAVRGLLGSLFVRESYVFPDPFRFDRLPNGGVLNLSQGVSLPVRTFFVLAVAALLAFWADRLLTRTPAGRALQAISSDWLGARVVGLPVDGLLAAAFALAGSLAALAAVVAAPSAPVTVDTGALLGLEGLVAALVAGFGSPGSVFVAGLGLGVAQAWITSFHIGGVRLGPAYRDVAPLALAVLVMAARRGGTGLRVLARPPRSMRAPEPSGRSGEERSSWRLRANRELGRAVIGLGRELSLARARVARRIRHRPPLMLGALAMASAAPIVFPQLRVAAFAAALYTMVAAVGLNVVVGLAGMPSLGQGAFMGIGAFAAAWLRVRRGWDPGPALIAGVLFATVAGGVVALAAVRLRAQFVAVVTWLVSWFVLIGLEAFPSISGGAQGLVVPEPRFELPLARLGVTLTPALHYEVALALVFGAILAYQALARGPAGLGLSAARQAPDEARTLGIQASRLQLGAFVASAAVAGLAGAMLVQLTGVADPTAFGPLLSVELFVAVLLGGAGRPWAPVAGVMVLGVIPRVAGLVGDAAGIAPERFEPILAAALLVGALVLGRGGILALVERSAQRLIPRGTHRGERREADPAPEVGPGRMSFSPLEPLPARIDGPALRAKRLTKRFGGVTALEDVSVSVRAGEVRALIGPNGSGKTTFLRAVAGESAPDRGRVFLGAIDLSTRPEHVRVLAGIVHTLARPTVFGDLTALQHVIVGTTVRHRLGALRHLLATPQARAESAAAEARAREILSLFGLDRMASRRASTLSAADQRLLMVATAYATAPSVLLMDEPSAGMRLAETARLVQAVEALRARGLAVLLVDHNLQLVRLVAGHVTVLDAGRVIAEGTPEEVAANPLVVRTYLGPAAAAFRR